MNKLSGFFRTVKKLSRFLKKEKLAITIAIVFAVLSVASMIILPQVLGDATDVVITGLMQKSVYKQVTNGYDSATKMLNEAEELKAIVKSINELQGEEREVFDHLLYWDRDVGYLKNQANIEGTFDEETTKSILAIPVEANAVSLRKILGYYFDGKQVYEPLDKVDMTFGEYVEFLGMDINYENYMPKNLVPYFKDLKINPNEEYLIKSEYENSKTVGEYLEKSKLEDSFVIPKAYKDTIYSTSLTQKPEIAWDVLYQKIIILVVLAFVYSCFAYLQGFVLTGVAQRVSFEMRYQVNKKLFTMPMKNFDKKEKGDILSVISNDIDSISNALNQTIAQIITTIAMMVGVLVMMIRLNFTLSLVAIACIPISLLLMNLIVKKSSKNYAKMQQALAKVNSDVEESFRGHDTIQLFNKEQDHIDIFNMENEELAKVSCKSQFISNLMQPISKFIGNLSYVGACVFGGMIVISGALSIGNLQSFVQYLRQFTQPINQISSLINLISQSMAATDRVFEIIDIEDEKDCGNIALESKIKGDISFENISFAYNKDYVIKDFSFKVEKGQKVAIVGKTGAGKTTLIKLLLKFYELNKGKILIDGIDIKDCKNVEIRKHIGIVLQDAWLFEGKIKDNISYGSEIEDNKVEEAAKKAMAHEFIEKLDNKYDHIVHHDAANISLGQKQLLTIARAIYKDKEILILDEATSSVDTKTEKALQDAMDNLIKDKTSFIIAHRLSTIKNADIILVIDDGNIVEKGNHKALMKEKGVYYNLYKSQFKC